jgi:glycosyltransferase involved in cell wall biosynthesis
MKSLLAVDVDVSLPGGLETHVRETAAALVARGHDVHLAARPAARPEAMPGCPLAGSIEPERYDVVHEHGVRVLPALVRAPNVVKTIHFCTAAKMAAYVRIGRLRTLAHPLNWRAAWTERRTCRTRWTRIAVSPRVRDDCARWYGLDAAATRVIPNGARFMPPAVSREALRARHGIPAGAPLLLTVGRDDFVKGYGLLADAWRVARCAERGVWWVTAGGSAPAKSAGRIVTGPLPHADVNDWVHAADLGALPSFYEGCSLAHLEMLAGGLHTLAHDVGLCAAVTRAGENGEIIEPTAPAWTRALDAWLSRTGHRGGGLDPGYDWAALTARVEAVYEEALKGAS